MPRVKKTTKVYQKHLMPKFVKETLIAYPTISTLDELIAIKGCRKDQIPEDELKKAQEYIDRNRLRQVVMLKQELYHKQDLKSHETLFKMICDKEELKRFGISAGDTNVNVNPTIEIKCADPDIMDKIKSL